MRLTRLLAYPAAALACTLPGASAAQGFGLNEVGSCAVARGAAVTAVPCNDPSTIYWNPAATTMLKGWSAYAGVAAIVVSGSFTADTSGVVYPGNVPTQYPPHAFINYGGSNWAAGVGVYVPYGLTTQWNPDFPGRFSAIKTSLSTVYIQPNVAYEVVPGWSVGGGPIIGHSSAELSQAVDLSQQIAVAPTANTPAVTFGQLGVPAGTEFARVTFKGSKWAYGVAVGIHGTLGQAVQIGARYLSRITFDYSNGTATFQQRPTGLVVPAALTLPGGPTIPAGTPLDLVLGTQFQQGGPLVSQGASTTVPHPAQFQVGLGFTGLPRATLSVDYEWIGWSAFSSLPLQFNGPASTNNRTLIEDYRNSWTLRTGVEYAMRNGWAARAGFSYVRTPAPDVTVTPLLPDMDRYNFGLGAGIPLGRTFKLDASYLRVETEGRRGRIIERTSEAQTAAQLNGGWYTLHANIFSLSLRAGL